jgi:hypothetical protein
MTTAVLTRARRYAIAEPIKAAWEHGNQFLVTSAAAFMSAAFSMQHDVLPVWVAVPLAIGFEWTYLRGLATADKTTRTPWAIALNWAAMLTSLIYGILYVLGHYHIIPDKPETGAAIALAFAHVFPMALLSFCGANLRRNQKQEELKRNLTQKDGEQERAIAAEEMRRTLLLEQEQKDLEFARWEKAQRVQLELKLAEKSSNAAMRNAQPKMRRDAQPEPVNAVCPKCGIALDKPQWLAARRWGHCATCKDSV